MNADNLFEKLIWLVAFYLVDSGGERGCSPERANFVTNRFREYFAAADKTPSAPDDARGKLAEEE